MRISFTNGCFDILHVGHIELLRYAKSVSDYLIVALDTDDRVIALKGPKRPFNTLQDRMAMVRAIRYVNEVTSFSTDLELESLVASVKPDIMIVGSDYKGKRVIGSESAKSLLFFERINGYSTTKILESSFNR